MLPRSWTLLVKARMVVVGVPTRIAGHFHSDAHRRITFLPAELTDGRAGLRFRHYTDPANYADRGDPRRRMQWRWPLLEALAGGNSIISVIRRGSGYSVP